MNSFSMRLCVLCFVFSPCLLGCGASPPTPEEKIVGKWTGSMRIDMEKLKEMTKDNLAEQIMLQATAPAMAKDSKMTYEFSASGTVTKLFELPKSPLTGEPESSRWSGSWKVISADEGMFVVENSYTEAPLDPTSPIIETCEIQFDAENADACVIFQAFEIYDLTR